jgi:hypothetical protein
LVDGRSELAVPAEGALVFKASISQALTLVALTGAAVACTHTTRGSQATEPAAVASRDDASAPTSLVAETSAPADDESTMTPLEYKRCGDEAVAKYNTMLLLEAARCFEGAGYIGLAVHANRALISRHPEHAEAATDENQRLFRLVLDAEVALKTPVGRQCVEPLHEDGASASDYVEAADCLYFAGLAAAALHHRELAREQPGTFDVEANERKIVELTEALARVEQVASRPDGEPPS